MYFFQGRMASAKVLLEGRKEKTMTRENEANVLEAL